MVERLDVTQNTFTPEPDAETPNPKPITYNQLHIKLTNGDEFDTKLSKDGKIAVYYAQREGLGDE